MKLAVYYHDAHLPYSRYLIQGFLDTREFDEVLIMGPLGMAENTIFNQGQAIKGDPRLIFTKSSRINPKWMVRGQVHRILAKFCPDVFLILDEALSWNVLVGARAAKKTGPSGATPAVLFYAFENIFQSPPWKWFMEKPGLSRLIGLGKKTLRFVLFDKVLMPFRKSLGIRGLYAYPECADVIHRHGWFPHMAEAWFPVDTKRFSGTAPAEPADKTRARWDIPPDHRVLAFAGRFIREKGLESLIRSLPLLKVPATLLLIGSGPEETHLKTLAGELSVSGKIRFCGPMDAETLGEHYRIMDLLLLPSLTGTFWKEQLGRVLLEAMAAGVNVAGSNSGAIPHVMGRPDAVFQENDPQSIACVIENVLSRPGDRNTLVLRSARASCESFIRKIKEIAQT